ncbi:uncharacterized protein LOC132165007 [Corylus avellana]|uniref:uncharacterized protein LOC132165001 n=1 Tax=Corylus avellana TaxID=13451 RepID=UPI001E1F5208|nr:uncharacterized protein LOC132165001 [Corylus avellana]XP_059431504.1 uncharacterized protein LOC132165007 [Corylus avellana]
MELEQPILDFEQLVLREAVSVSAKKVNQNHSKASAKTTNAYRPNTSQPSDHRCRRSESSRALEMGVPWNYSPEEKLSWVRSQIIGGEAEIDSPSGKRRLTYADHTATGRSLLYIENFITHNVLPFYGNTHTCDSYVGDRTTKLVREASNYIKKCLGGGNDDSLLFCGSGSTGAIKKLQEIIGVAVTPILRERVLKCLTKEERWVVFVGPYEHHSNLLSWRNSLAQVVEIGLDDDGLIDMEALRLQLESYKHANRPILGSFSACSNVTGIYSDTRAIARLLHQYGGVACFDFAASGPYVEIDMRSGEMDGYDAIFLSPHKFLGGPGSPGILLMSNALYLLKSSPPSTCGGGTVNYVNGFSEKHTVYKEEIEERENAGTPQIIQTIRASLAFRVKEYIGYQVIENKEQAYIHRALQRLLPNKNIWILGNTTTKRQAILSFLIYSTTNSTLGGLKNNSREIRDVLNMWGESGNKRDKPLHGPLVASLLNDLFGIQARGGCACAGPYGHVLLGVDDTYLLAFSDAVAKGYVGTKPGWARISFPYYMSEEEFEFILDALEFLAIYGQRFIPLYHYNFETGAWTFKKKALQELLNKENILEDYNSKACGDEKRKMSKYRGYLEAAKYIASLLPKFPSQRRLPEQIDPNLFHFRI